MKRKNTTRNALFTSIISMLLCVSMLVGTTFAWFTDEVKSGANQIIAGNLDVEVTHTNDTVADESILNTEKLFKDVTLWEPGAVAYEKITVKNVGTLALKYNLSVNFTNENFVLTDGELYGLSQALQIAVVDAEKLTSREAALAEAKAAEKSGNLHDFVLAGELEAKENATYGIVIWWEPSAEDNNWNVNNGKLTDDSSEYLHIDLGLKVLATQLNVEEDSFGPDYDEDAIYTDFVVTNEEELKEALAKAEDGDIIGMKGNVTWTTGAAHGSTPFIENATTYTVKPAVKNITLLGLEEGATFTAIGKGVGPIGIDGGTVTFKNLKIVDESVSYNEGAWELGYLEFRGNTVFENCDVVNAVMTEGDSAIFKNCSFNSHKDSEYAVWVSNGNATFENCFFTGSRGLKMHEAYGSEVGTVVINNNQFVELSKKPGLAIGTVNADTTVVITNNTFVGTQAGDQGLYSYETDTDVTAFNFTYEDNKVVTQDSDLPQGLYKVDENTWMASNTDALNQGIAKAEDGQTVVLAQDVIYTGNGYANITKNITLDLNGKTLSTTTLGVVAKAGTIKNGIISNPVGARAALRTWSGVSVENVIIEAPKNGGITVASGNALPYIKNVTINAKTYGIELQYGASVGTIENVNIVAGENGIVVQAGTIGKITNSAIKGSNAGIFGQLKGIYDLNITLDSTNEVRGDKYGIFLCDEGATIVPDGIAYLTYNADAIFEGGVKDQEFAFGQTGKLVVNGAKIGAFIATADELFAFANAVNVEGKTFNGLTVMLTADIDLENKVWTPIGQTGATEFKGIFDGQNYTIKNLNVDSSAQTGANYSSGLFGWVEGKVIIKNVNIDGAKVVGNHNVAVLVGYTYSGRFTNCHVTNAEIICNHANDDACGDKCGLIVGYAGDESRITDCSASNSSVKGGRDAGQLIGTGYNVSVSNCSATNVTVGVTEGCTHANAGKNIREDIIGRVMG